MALTQQQRDKKKQIRDLIYRFLTIVDINSKFVNRDYYEKFFDTVSDDDFIKWADKIGTEIDATITVTQLPFEEASLEQIKEAMEKILNVPLEEYVYMKHIKDGTEIKTKYPVPVGYISIKRMQQLLNKKNKYSIDNTQRNYKYGQVTGDSRVGHMSDNEFYALITQGAKHIVSEIVGPRSDDEKMKQFMYKKINNDGYFSMTEAESESARSQNTSLSAWIAYSLSSGIILESSNDSLLSKNYKTDFTIAKELFEKK